MEHQGLRLQIIQQGGRRGVQQRQKFVRASRAFSRQKLIRFLGQPLFGPDRRFPPQPRGKPLYFFRQAPRAGNQHLRGRGQSDFLQGVVGPPLGFRIEIAQGIDLVPPELHPDRRGGVGSKKVQDAAPYRELARALHLLVPLIPGGAEQSLNFFQGRLLSCPQGKPFAPQLVRRDSILQGGVNAGDHHLVIPIQHSGHSLKPLVFIFPGLALGGPEIEIPGGINQGGGAHGRQIIAEPLALALVGGEHQGFPPGSGAERVDQMSLMDPGNAGHRHGSIVALHRRHKGFIFSYPI